MITLRLIFFGLLSPTKINWLFIGRVVLGLEGLLRFLRKAARRLVEASIALRRRHFVFEVAVDSLMP